MAHRDYVSSSIEINLFFLRIMKEHLIFIEADLSQRDIHLSHKITALRNEASNLLRTTISLANVCGLQVSGSGEFVTSYTLKAEQASEFYTGIAIDKDITATELSIGGSAASPVGTAIVDQVNALNNSAIAVTQAISAFKVELLQDVLSCRTFSHSYPSLIDHVNREAQFYLKTLHKIQTRVPFDLAREAVEQEIFWNRIMGEHAKVLRGQLDPTEEALFDKSHLFGKEFDRLTTEAITLTDNIARLPQVTANSIQATTAIRNFKLKGVQGMLGCEIKITALPLIADHMLREANHYLRMLHTFHKAR